MRRLIVLGLVAGLGWGCGSGAGNVTGSAASTSVQASEAQPAERRSVTVDLRDRFLLEHNAQFFRGRTFRWVAPIPLPILTGDPDVNGFLFEQFAAWERALAGAGGRPLFSLQPSSSSPPARGIFFVLEDLPGSVVGLGDPFSPLGEARRRISLRAAARHVEAPEILTNGQILRCRISLDPVIFDDAEVAAAVIRHEIGHCLGFIGHVSNRASLMHATSCCPLTITADVTGMMRRLYRLAPATRVTR